jgi:hypothetical protein
MMRTKFVLPKLDGRRIVIVRRAYLTLAVFVLFGITGNLISDTLSYLVREPAVARYGFILGGDPATVAPVWLDQKAEGISDGDRVLAVNGVPLHAGGSYIAAEQQIARAGPVLQLDVADDAGHFSRHRLVRGPKGGSRILPDEKVSFFAYGLSTMIGEFLGDIVPFMISMVLFLRRTSDPEAMLLAFAFLMMSNIGGNGSWPHEIGIPAGRLIGPIFQALALEGWNLMLIAICAFPNGKFETRWSRIAPVISFIYGQFLIVSIFYLSRRLFSHLLFQVFDCLNFGGCVMSLVLRYRVLAPGVERQQIKWALFGAIIMALGAMVTFVVALPGVETKLGPLELITDNLVILKELAFPLGLMVSLLRFRLYDADDIITRSAGYGGLTIALVGVFAAADQFAQSTSQHFLGDSIGSWSSGVGAAAAALTISPLHNRIMHWTERRFRSKLVLLRDGLPLLLGDMRDLATPQALAQATLDHIEGGVHARAGAVVQGEAVLALANIDGNEVREWLARTTKGTNARVREVERSDKVFPLRIALHGYHEAADGWLLLGPGRTAHSTLMTNARLWQMRPRPSLARSPSPPNVGSAMIDRKRRSKRSASSW